MRAGPGTLAMLALVILLADPLAGSPPQAAKPLSEQELVSLLEKGVSSSALASMVESYGISFRPDDATFARLKKSGAQESLLESLRQKIPGLRLTIQGGSITPATPTSEPNTLRASRHLELGQRKAQERDFEGALGEFAEAERIEPQWDAVFYHRGLALAALGRYSDAAAEWKKYLAVSPGGVDKEPFLRKIAEWTAEAQKMEKVQGLLEQGNQQLRRIDAEGAVNSFREAATLDHSMGNLLDLARAQLLRGDYEALAETARNALLLDPHSSRAALYQAAAELRHGDTDKSMATLQEALALNPSLAYGYALLGEAVRQKADRKPGTSTGRGEAGTGTDSAMAHNRLGWVLWNGGDFRAGLEELHRAVQMEPTNASWYCDLAYARNARGDTAGAAAAAREAVRLSPNSACGHHALGLALEGRGALEQAAREYEEALKLSPVPHPAFLYCLNRVRRSQTRAQQ